MPFSPDESRACSALAALALAEDLAERGDLTSTALIPPDLRGKAGFVVRQPGVVAGLPAVQLVSGMIDEELSLTCQIEDGTAVEPGTLVATLEGPMQSLLTTERTALNFLQRLSGVATQTAQYVRLVAGLSCQILDTRKTTPGWRLLEKYAVRMGGGHNHRMGLYDGFLIKDNHLAALGNDSSAITRAIGMARQHKSKVPVEVEVDTLEQFDLALVANPDIILLDNMTTDQLTEAVRRRDSAGSKVRLEASGGIQLDTLRRIAETGVDRISIGALTHSARALDIGLDYLT